MDDKVTKPKARLDYPAWVSKRVGELLREQVDRTGIKSQEYCAIMALTDYVARQEGRDGDEVTPG